MLKYDFPVNKQSWNLWVTKNRKRWVMRTGTDVSKRIAMKSKQQFDI